MEIIYLDAAAYETAEEVHEALRLLLNLPDYYGRNADALHDCLSERARVPALRVKHGGNEAVEIALAKVQRVFDDLEDA